MDSLFTTALPASFPLYKSVLLPLPCRDLHMAAMVADPRLQFSADPEKPIFAGEISGSLFISGQQTVGNIAEKRKQKKLKRNAVRSGNRKLSTNQLVVILILYTNSTSALVTKPLPSRDLIFDNFPFFPHCQWNVNSNGVSQLSSWLTYVFSEFRRRPST